ncbi:MAG: arsenic metallochaperone ArsD family protein [Candidatus Methanomethylophilaceae archaeon]|nr:arsenic metallochaperone ArsD family protein [Candidatus Methanomethylophilaceae archaeon]
MNSKLTVYEAPGSTGQRNDDAARFHSSVERLAEAGIDVRCITCRRPSDMDTRGEAWETLSSEGLGSLPLAEYDGVLISSGRYPSDQELADFLSPPDGTLSVDSSKPYPMGNNSEQSCHMSPR